MLTAQQYAKLMASYLMKTEFAVVVDAKNAIMSDLPAHTFIDESERAILNGAVRLYAMNGALQQ